jgi:hypothetical protein
MQIGFIELVAAIVGIPAVAFSLINIIQTFVRLWREKEHPNENHQVTL